MILIALHEHEIPSETPNEELSHNTRDLYRPEPQSEVREGEEREDQGTVTDHLPESSPEHLSGDNHADEDAHSTDPSARSGGEWPCVGNTLTCIELYQLREETGRTGLLRLLHLYPIFPRRRPEHSSPSRLPWKPPPPSMTNTRFVRDPLL